MQWNVLRALIAACALLINTVRGGEQEWLRSWNETDAKAGIIDFVTRVTDEGGADFVPVDDRIAVFDNDGTLWCEQPLVEKVFAQQRAIRLRLAHPDWWHNVVCLETDEDLEFAGTVNRARLLRIVAATHNGITQRRFQQLVASFFRAAKHPRFHVGFTELAYQPMLELLAYLRAHGFETWICSASDVDFVRVISRDVYGIPPQQVIGSSWPMEFREVDGEWGMFRPLDEKLIRDRVVINDQKQKPASIDLHIGRQPIFAVGNVGSAGDVDMLRYCHQVDGPNLQLLIHHDDARREFAYDEEGNVSLSAARKNGWTVVSMRDDWNRVFSSTASVGSVETITAGD